MKNLLFQPFLLCALSASTCSYTCKAQQEPVAPIAPNAPVAPNTPVAPKTNAIVKLIEPAAEAILERSRRAYQSAKTLSWQIDSEIIDVERSSSSRYLVDYQTPRRLRVRQTLKNGLQTRESGSVFVSDGEQAWNYNPQFDRLKYSRALLPGVSYGSQALMQFGPLGFLSTPFVSNVPPFAAPWSMPVDTLKVVPGEYNIETTQVPDQTVQSVAVDRISARRETPGQSETWIYSIGREDGWVRQIRYVSETTLPDGETLPFATIETHSNFRKDELLPATTWQWFVPNGTDVDAFGPSMADVRLRVGANPLPLPTAMRDIAGREFTFEEYRGRVLLLHFWNSLDANSRRELAWIQRLNEKYSQRGLQIVSININDERADFDRFRQINVLPWRHIFAGTGSELNRRYQVRALPYTLLIGRDGRIADANNRALLLEEAVSRALDRP